MIALKTIVCCIIVTYLWNDCEAWSPHLVQKRVPSRPSNTFPFGVALRNHRASTSCSIMLLSEEFFEVEPLAVAGVAVVLGVAAQGFINQMLDGDDGLGAFLKDGSGYNKSGYKKSGKAKEDEPKDPLPWLKLPKLDFVEVAGQNNRQEELVYEQLERMRQDMNEKLQEGKVEQAAAIRDELEGLMTEAGIDFN
jgi:hypothetical protein